ncbi:MAG: hypothetical protein ACI8RZ_003558, partial [Myxococcota bacterium]
MSDEVLGFVTVEGADQLREAALGSHLVKRWLQPNVLSEFDVMK